MAYTNQKFGEIWLVNFEPQVGSEIRKIRPAIVLSSDFINANQSLRIIMPLTSWQEKFSHYPWMIKVNKSVENGLENDSAINALQIKSFSLERFISKLGVANSMQIKAAISVLNTTINNDEFV